MKNSDSRKTFTEEIQGTISEIISQIKKLIKEGNARRVLIKNKKGKVLFQSQLTVGVGGAVMLTAIAPIVAAISTFALFMNDVKIIVERYPDEDTDNDEYEVEAEYIEIRDDEEEKASDQSKKEGDKTDKTVGKDKNEDDE